MRKFACLLGALVVASMSLSAVAQSKVSNNDASKWSIFGGYAYLHYSNGTNSTNSQNITANANGFIFSGAYSLTNMFSVVGEYGFYHASSLGGINPGAGASVTANLQTYLFGPKASFKMQGPITPFAQVLIGARTESLKDQAEALL
jgi:hypothetical protein